MPYSTSRRTRERRLRAYYRRKIWTVAIIMLIIGLVLGFAACVYTTKNNDRVADLLKLAPQKVSAYVTPSPAPADADDEAEAIAFGDDEIAETEFDDAEVEAAEEVIAAPTIAVVEVVEATEAPTAEPTAAPTEAPTAEPTAITIVIPESIAASVEVTEAPTAEPTVEPTVEPTAAPTEAPTAEPTAEPTVAPTEAPTAEPTAEPTVEPTAAPVVEAEPVVVAYGESATFQTEIKADGTARRAADADAFETLDITMQVKAYKDPAYFAANYAEDYNLQGNEAAVEFEITLNGYTGSTEIIPQNFMLITFCGETEDITSQGFQLMDTEIAGNTNVAISSDNTMTLYKRYPYNAEQGDMTYMVVNTYVDGVEYTHNFEIIAPVTEETAAAETAATAASGDVLTIGSKNDEVKKLQAKLIELGLLSGQPDGHFGNYTASAVKEMQRRFGMEQTGIADQAFLNRLYQ